uniref:Uncharacterized protein n=1 Tax=Arundo donax TaxID=35708 RepID=A0A0A9DDS1_ARUDO
MGRPRQVPTALSILSARGRAAAPGGKRCYVGTRQQRRPSIYLHIVSWFELSLGLLGLVC